MDQKQIKRKIRKILTIKMKKNYIKICRVPGEYHTK